MWSAAASWTPLNNYMFEVHQYLDKDGSGGSSGIVSPTIGADRLAGRYGVGTRPTARGSFWASSARPADAASLAALDTMLAYIQHNRRRMGVCDVVGRRRQVV